MRAFLDHKRRRSADEVSTAEVPETPADADQGDLRLTLLAALGHLSPRERAIVVLRYWEDMSVRDVADMLRMSQSNVKVQSMRALSKLRTLLDEETAADTATGRF